MAPPAKKMKRCNNKENKLNNSIKNYFKTVEQPESQWHHQLQKKRRKPSKKLQKLQNKTAKETAIIEKPKKVVKKSKKATKTISEDQNDVPTQSEPSNFALTSLKFKNLAELYPWVDEKLTRIVFKTKSSIEVLMSEFCLFSTYKCMNEVCEFFTTDFDEFKKHMIEHSDSNCHYCSFCLKGFEKPSELGTHIDLNHRYDRFQCNYCMLRSFTSSETPKKYIEKCRTKHDKKSKKFVSSYRCKTPRCKESFYCKTNYRKHLESEKTKPSCSEFGTIIDEQMKKIDHSKTSNKLEGFTECLFCHYGTDEDDILEHMSMNHQSEFAYICKRSMPTFVVARETLLTHTTIEFVGAHPSETCNFGGDLEKLKSK
ncbi:hypothetical protein PVAND_012644 [Polypedilum vanderplanki]|uniref:C2H2-type domain-containing protein n=1 Tax=Polypedilum vanderplanki TaxID=319348 RepID=A0A9J6CP21_POLVA|nr:hypothetical protein PVAND_012644 [Polypedilum vanderplanki]